MHAHTVSSREFTRDVGAAKRATSNGPVFITDRGRPAYALLRIEDYYRLSREKPRSLLQVMDAVAGGAFAFDPPKLAGALTPVEMD